MILCTHLKVIMAKRHRGELMNKGYIERIPGGPGYAGGHQYSDKGRELIRTSGLPQEFQRGLGHYESSPARTEAPVRSTPTRDPNEGRHHFNTGGLVSLVL